MPRDSTKETKSKTTKAHIHKKL